MQTILGSGGSIGVELAKALPEYTSKIRLMSRNPQKINKDDELYPGDLTDAQSVSDAVKGSDIVYLTVGLPYNIKIWRSTWPVIMQNVISACKEHQAKLVFFDNVYAYDCRKVPFMTEETPINPCSKKGKVRAEIIRMIMNEVEKGTLTALIARSADFYGPGGGNNCVLVETVVKNYAKGKKAMWLGSVKYKHSYTYIPDAGKATALLGNTNDAYQQAWHIPTSAEAYTGKDWIEAIAKELNVKPQYTQVGKTMMSIVGWFNPLMREIAEMMYQNDRDYFFSSEKFEKRFNMPPTKYTDGIREMINKDFKN